MTSRTLRQFAARSAIAAASAIALAASAQSTGTANMKPRTQFDSAGYLGLNLGRSKYKTPCGGAAFVCGDSAHAFQIYGGTMFSERLGVELGYLDFGEVARGGGVTRARGLNLSVVGNLPVTPSVGLYGKIGTTYGRTETSSVAGSGVIAGSDSGFGLSYGFGVNYAITPKVSGVAGWDSHDLRFSGSGRDAIHKTTIGIKYRY